MFSQGLCQHLNLASWKTCSLIYHLQICTTSYHQSERCLWAKDNYCMRACLGWDHKCLLFESTVPSQLNSGNDVGLPFLFLSMSEPILCKSECCAENSILSGSALLAHWLLGVGFNAPRVFRSVKVSGLRPNNVKWKSSRWKRRIHHIMAQAIAVDSGRGPGCFLTLPHCSVWLSGREALIGAPSPCRALLTSLL